MSIMKLAYYVIALGLSVLAWGQEHDRVAGPVPDRTRLEAVLPRAQFVRIQSGIFWMGCDNRRFRTERPLGTSEVLEERERCYENETHRIVTLTNRFEMQTTEVTQAQWWAVMRSNPAWDQSNDQLPVNMITWNDVQEYLRRLNDLTDELGYLYRLPTEAEWEFAARAGTSTTYFWGDTPSSEYAESGVAPPVAPVASLLPNRWGLYDMAGSMWEWTSDCYQEDLGTAPARNPRFSTGCYAHVARGGRPFGRLGYPDSARASTRIGAHEAHGSIGLRLVRQPRH